jgi:hypothetical protein
MPRKRFAKLDLIVDQEGWLSLGTFLAAEHGDIV